MEEEYSPPSRVTQLRGSGQLQAGLQYGVTAVRAGWRDALGCGHTRRKWEAGRRRGGKKLQMVRKREEGGSGGRRGEPFGRMEAGRTDRVGPVLAPWPLPEPAPPGRVGPGRDASASVPRVG